MKLVENAKQVWHHYSTIALGMAGGLQGAWASIPESIKTDLPDTVPKVVAWVTFAVAMLGLGGKFIDQTPKDAT
jgi:hypothetical protein